MTIQCNLSMEVGMTDVPAFVGMKRYVKSQIFDEGAERQNIVGK